MKLVAFSNSAQPPLFFLVGFEGACPHWHFLASLVWFQAGCQAIRPTADGYGISQGDPGDSKGVSVRCDSAQPQSLLYLLLPSCSALISSGTWQLKHEASSGMLSPKFCQMTTFLWNILWLAKGVSLEKVGHLNFVQKSFLFPSLRWACRPLKTLPSMGTIDWIAGMWRKTEIISRHPAHIGDASVGPSCGCGASNTNIYSP